MIRVRGALLVVSIAAAFASAGARADEPTHPTAPAAGPIAPAFVVCETNGAARSHARLAQARLAMRDALGSAAAIRRALGLAPRCARFWASLGDALWFAGRGGSARSAWATALRLDPEDRVARARLPPHVEHGWQTHAVDLAAIGVVVAGLAVGAHARDAGSVLVWSGVSIFVLGPPIVHLAYENFWGAVGSLILRLTLPVAGFALGVAADWEPRLAGFVGALFVADALEVAVIGRASPQPDLPRWPSETR